MCHVLLYVCLLSSCWSVHDKNVRMPPLLDNAAACPDSAPIMGSSSKTLLPYLLHGCVQSHSVDAWWRERSQSTSSSSPCPWPSSSLTPPTWSDLQSPHRLTACIALALGLRPSTPYGLSQPLDPPKENQEGLHLLRLGGPSCEPTLPWVNLQRAFPTCSRNDPDTQTLIPLTGLVRVNRRMIIRRWWPSERVNGQTQPYL